MTDRHTTNTTPALTPEREAEIRARAAHLYEYVYLPAAAEQVMGEDVPALLAELDRLRAWHKNFKSGVTVACDQMRKRLADAEAELDRVRAERDEALARVAELERPAVEAKRNEIRSSYSELIAQAEQDRDHEGAFEVQCRLREREAEWKAEDAAVDDDGLCQSEYSGDDGMHAGQLCTLPAGHRGAHQCNAAIAGTPYRRTLAWI